MTEESTKKSGILSKIWRIINAFNLFAILGVILILVGTFLPAITFTFEATYAGQPINLMWNGDLYNDETGDKFLDYNQARDVFKPFLTNPITPDLLLYLILIVAFIGIVIRLIGLKQQKSTILRLGVGFIIPIVFICVWICTGIFFLYFLEMQASTRGIDVFKSLGIILIVLGNICFIPVMGTSLESERR